ncbi:MAG: flagellar biosynthesis/type III secretory pathway M-ring protein FliF/YscJ [Candidatus Krumholzibacteriia bacterium]|jgi:flagellar biosynthesis/type III secretory pathway M-ring protein FliF/YscJ
MFLLRLVLLLIFFMMIRRIFRSWRSAMVERNRKPDTDAEEKKATEVDYSDLTEQGIDDADFEEIP